MADRPQSRHRRMPHIADVATIAGVSPATVSRALSNPDIVTTETRERVLEAVRQTGYTPNIAGRNLRARRSMMALVVVPSIANPFFAEVLRGIDETLSAAGYGLIIGNLDNSIAKETKFVDLVFAGQVDGVLLLNGHVPASNGRDLTSARIPLVAACEIIPGAPFPQVEVQNREAARHAVSYLASLGHSWIAYLSGPSDNILEHQRRRGFREGCLAARITAGPETVFGGDFTFRAGAEAARAYLALDPRPTAVFAANDEMAIGFLKAVHAAGLAVPGDVSIVGFDGIEYADYCDPTLSTVRQPRRAIGATAAARLVDLMTGRAKPSAAVTRLETTLVARGSSGPPRVVASRACG